MRIKRVELNNFKRFTHLIVEDIPQTAKLVLLVGPNGSGKTSFLEAMNHYYKCSGFADIGDYKYLSKGGNDTQYSNNAWFTMAKEIVNIEFYDAELSKTIGGGDTKGHFYFRSAYRNEPDFEIQYMGKQINPTEEIRLSTLNQNDETVSLNYQRLVANTVLEVFNTNNDSKHVAELREKLTGVIGSAIERVFGDLHLSSLGEPLSNGSFYFSKGIVKDFNYRNLSAGEKSAFDLILDIVVKGNFFQEAIYCIDEPEAHMHTRLQGKVLREIYGLVPQSSQLWISTHSIGMLNEADEIEKEYPGTVAFLDFGGRDFDTDQVIYPAKIGKAVWNKFYELAFGDYAKLILPKVIVFCEGDINGGKRKDFDKRVYSNLFGENHPEALFLSGGSCNDIEKIEETHGVIISSLLKNSKVIKVVDRDDRTDEEIADLMAKGIRVLKRRNLESYLLDDKVIQKLCESVGKKEVFEECIEEKKKAIDASIRRENAEDDLKSASGEIYNALKKKLKLKQCGNNVDTFLRDTITQLITCDMLIYKEFEEEIFG